VCLDAVTTQEVLFNVTPSNDSNVMQLRRSESEHSPSGVTAEVRYCLHVRQRKCWLIFPWFYSISLELPWYYLTVGTTAHLRVIRQSSHHSPFYGLQLLKASLFLWWRAPQQKLRTHRSLEVYCATLWWRWLGFFVFPSNGAPVERNWQENPNYSGKNLPQCYFVYHKPHMDWPGIEPGPPRWEAGD
jgi:hypothetical protein